MSDLDAMYPELSRLARAHGYSLASLARPTPAAERFIRLSGCCYMVSNEWPRHGADAYNYLATVNALAGHLVDQDARERLWRKLVGGTPTAFLDVVVEAAWALYFWRRGIPASLEETFDPANPASKDADVAVVLDGAKHWLDVVNAKVEGRNPFERVAERKYRDKFHTAVQSGLLRGASLGILICILKSEEVIAPFPIAGRPPAPPGLFARCPGLNLVLFHLLRSGDRDDVLWPLPVLRWDRDRTRIPV